MAQPLFARRERSALCDLAAELGPAAPTLCDGWDAKELLAHLVVRERRPVAALGILSSRLAGRHDKAVAKVARTPFPELVEKVRRPAPVPWSLPPVEAAFNTVEFFVHHEDLRRGQAAWERRELAAEDEKVLWSMLKRGGRVLVRKADVPVDVTDPVGRTATLQGGDDPVTVTGPVSELVMFVYGRNQVRDLSFDGPPERVAALRQASLGL